MYQEESNHVSLHVHSLPPLNVCLRVVTLEQMFQPQEVIWTNPAGLALNQLGVTAKDTPAFHRLRGCIPATKSLF
jgi:hypothetical protein